MPAYQPRAQSARKFPRLDLTERATTEHVPAFSFATAHAELGEVERAFEWLERAYDRRDTSLVYLNYGFFSRISSDPRLVDLARRMGLPQG